jgi:prepilin-type processing-associated H-X9-DG protein
MRTRKPQPAERALTQDQVIVSVVEMLAVMTVGVLVGLVSGPYILPDLDLDVYYFDPKGRVYLWSFFCALGFLVIGSTVQIALAVHRRPPLSSLMRQLFSGLNSLLLMLALVSLPALFSWGWAFGPREAAVRAHCTYNLKTIAFAMHQYHDDFGCLPPAFIPDELGRPKHSWRVLLLPYLAKTLERDSEGLKRLYEAYDFSEPWDGPHNGKLAEHMPIVYGCRNDPGRRESKTCYVVIVGAHTAFPGSRSIRFDDIRDGNSNTILCVETNNSGINWMEPKDYPVEQLAFASTNAPAGRIGGNHAGGANIGFADGSVRFLHESEVSAEALIAIATIDGGEPIDQSHW